MANQVMSLGSKGEKKYIIYDDLSKVTKPDFELDPDAPGPLTTWLDNMDKYMHRCLANSHEVRYDDMPSLVR